MHVHRRLGARRAMAVVHAQQILGRVDRRNGPNLRDLRSASRCPAFHDQILKVAKTKGSGWVDYWLPKPGQTEPSQKWSYVKAVKAEGVAVVGAGFFPE